jgi:hypothetical protein
VDHGCTPDKPPQLIAPAAVAVIPAGRRLDSCRQRQVVAGRGKQKVFFAGGVGSD